jgi:two-component system response regulator AlgR
MSADMTQSTAFPGLSAPLRVLVVDDEELARLRLKSLVGECGDPTAVVVGEAANAAQALVWLATRSCDLLLLDVQMPGRDGTQLAAELRLKTPAPAVVFVTAHAQHALKAFDLEAIDYLTKPVKRERLQAALRRVAQRIGAPAAAANGAIAPEEEGPVIVVSDRGRIIRVPVADVLYMKAELKYVTLRTADHTHVLDDSLAELAERLGDRFLRVHRNALVAKRAVRALERRAIAGENADDGLEGWGVCIAPVNEWLAVSRRQVAAVREALVNAER